MLKEDSEFCSDDAVGNNNRLFDGLLDKLYNRQETMDETVENTHLALDKKNNNYHEMSIEYVRAQKRHFLFHSLSISFIFCYFIWLLKVDCEFLVEQTDTVDDDSGNSLLDDQNGMKRNEQSKTI